MNHAEKADTLAALPGIHHKGGLKRVDCMDDLTQLLRVTPATEIAKKWNVTGDRLNEIVDRYKLPLYFIREKRIRPDDGKIIYFCVGPSFSFYYEGNFPDGDYNLEGTYFNTDTVEEFEVAHPEILWAPAYLMKILKKNMKNIFLPMSYAGG